MNAEATLPQPADLRATRVALLNRYFFNRRDVVGVRRNGAQHPEPREVSGDIDSLLDLHVGLGLSRVGSYAPAADGTTRWLCFDLDGSGHSSPLADPAKVATDLKSALAQLGVPSYVERSGGGAGYHVWVFFSESVPASKVRAVGLALAPTDAPLATVGVADATKNKGVEVFPKQGRIAEGGFGNMVYLPFWSRGKNDGGKFFEPDADGTLVPFEPTDFETVGLGKLDELAQTLAPSPSTQIGTSRSSTSSDASPSRSKLALALVPSASASTKLAYADWRKKALAQLPLDTVYGEYLTGNDAGNGYLECRDPRSATGDRSPSASVADDADNVERGSFYSFRDNQRLSVFDFLIEVGKAKTFRDAARLIAELSGVPLPEPNKPKIITSGRQLVDVIDDAWRAVLNANHPEPFLFQRGSKVVRLIDDRNAAPKVEELSVDGMYGVLVRAAIWKSINAKGKEVDVVPSDKVARDMLAFPHAELPFLDALSSHPVFGRSGCLLARRGYHESDGVYIGARAEVNLGDLPSTPSPDDVASARQLLLDELLVDFPFVAPSDRAHAVAALLLPVVRRLIPGCTPMHVIQAPSPGSGKSLICGAIGLIVEGTYTRANPFPKKEEEIQKVIFSMLLSGQNIILFDNVDERSRGEVNSPSLAAVLTSTTYGDRVLGASKMGEVPNQALWLLTGNNPSFSEELTRRHVPIRIDAKVDSPWKRDDFKHPNLNEWIRAHRRELLRACVVLVLNWIALGRPTAKHTLGSFEEWASTMGGILQAAGIDGFLGDLERIYESADREGQEWRAFVGAWLKHFGSKPTRPSELWQLASDRCLMERARGNGNQQSQVTQMGNALLGAKNRIVSGHRIVLVEDGGHHGKRYALEPLSTSTGSDDRH